MSENHVSTICVCYTTICLKWRALKKKERKKGTGLTSLYLNEPFVHANIPYRQNLISPYHHLLSGAVESNESPLSSSSPDWPIPAPSATQKIRYPTNKDSGADISEDFPTNPTTGTWPWSLEVFPRKAWRRTSRMLPRKQRPTWRLGIHIVYVHLLAPTVWCLYLRASHAVIPKPEVNPIPKLATDQLKGISHPVWPLSLRTGITTCASASKNSRAGLQPL